MNLSNSLVVALSILTSTVLAQDIPEPDWKELDKTKPWEATEQWEPVPPVVTPGTYIYATPPSDAIVLFDGSDLSQWQKGQFKGEGLDADVVKLMLDKRVEEEREAPDWTVEDGQLIVKPESGGIETKRAFGDMQLHLEWNAPYDPGKEGQAYSNSGIFLMSLYEIQVLNNYKNTTYPNGQVGSIYKQTIPMANASRKPGEWQAYDIIFTAPRFSDEGELISPARVTVIHNGVVVQNNTEIKGPTVYIGKPRYVAHAPKMPLRLQDHRDLVRYRNIWVREL